VGLIWNPERLFVYSRYKKKIKVMPPENFTVTTINISMEEFSQIFPWFENLGIEKPKSKRGRKPKAKQMTDNAVEMKSSL
jgi:hypothetical protein